MIGPTSFTSEQQLQTTKLKQVDSMGPIQLEVNLLLYKRVALHEVDD